MQTSLMMCLYMLWHNRFWWEALVKRRNFEWSETWTLLKNYRYHKKHFPYYDLFRENKWSVKQCFGSSLRSQFTEFTWHCRWASAIFTLFQKYRRLLPYSFDRQNWGIESGCWQPFWCSVDSVISIPFVSLMRVVI